MKLFIFQDVDNMTSRYHTEGSVLVVAEKLMSAVEQFNKSLDKYEIESGVKLTEQDISKVITYELAGEYKEEVYKFENAGCC